MNYYKLRIDTNNKELTNALLKKYCSTYMVSYEDQDTDNPHCHMYIELLPTATTTALRKAIRTKFGSGNGSYSLKTLDEQFPIEYLAYIMKQKEYTYSSNFPVSMIDEAREYDLQVKETMKLKKENRKTILQKIEEKYFSEAKDNILNGEYITKRYVVKSVLDYYKSSKSLVRQFMIVSLSQTLCLQYVNSYDYEYENKILEYL